MGSLFYWYQKHNHTSTLRHHVRLMESVQDLAVGLFRDAHFPCCETQSYVQKLNMSSQ